MFVEDLLNVGGFAFMMSTIIMCVYAGLILLSIFGFYRKELSSNELTEFFRGVKTPILVLCIINFSSNIVLIVLGGVHG